MRNKNIGLSALFALAISVSALLLQPGASDADKGGCPNQAAGNGATHAADSSAFGPDKQAERCEAPEVTPTSAPTEGTDIAVTATTLISPDSATAGAAFPVSGSANVKNLGPLVAVLADVTFVLSMPADCTATSPTTVTFQDKSLPVNTNVYIPPWWSVTCTQPGSHEFTLTASVAIDPSQAVTDPNPGNDTGAASDTTTISGGV